MEETSKSQAMPKGKMGLGIWEEARDLGGGKGIWESAQ